MIIPVFFANLLPIIFAAPATCNNSFFGFPVWWKYIKPQPTPPDCEVVIDKFPDGLWAIGFAVIDMLLYLAGIAAIVAIIIAGVSFITSSGNVEKATTARRRIVNALVGLAIVVIASFVVGFIGNRVG